MRAAEYPGALWVPAASSNYRTGRRGPPTEAVIHCTDGHPDAMGVAEMWAEPGHGTSAHFVIGQDATVIQSVSLQDIAWHAHAASFIGIGIEHCARTPGEWSPRDPGLPPSDAQYLASARLVAWLAKRFGFNPVRGVGVKGHAEADPRTTHTRCPDGCGWNWELYMGLVASAYVNSAPTS